MVPAKFTTAVIAAAATLELPTAAVLVVDPSLFSWLLFDAAMTPPGEALGRISGVALLAFAAACWPRRGTGEGSIPRLQALFLFSALVAAYLLYLGIGGKLVGILLWPAVATHTAFAILLALTSSQNRLRSGQRGSKAGT